MSEKSNVYPEDILPYSEVGKRVVEISEEIENIIRESGLSYMIVIASVDEERSNETGTGIYTNGFGRVYPGLGKHLMRSCGNLINRLNEDARRQDGEDADVF